MLTPVLTMSNAVIRTSNRYWAGKSSDISYYLNSHHIDVRIYFLFIFLFFKSPPEKKEKEEYVQTGQH